MPAFLSALTLTETLEPNSSNAPLPVARLTANVTFRIKDCVPAYVRLPSCDSLDMCPPKSNDRIDSLSCHYTIDLICYQNESVIPRSKQELIV